MNPTSECDYKSRRFPFMRKPSTNKESFPAANPTLTKLGFVRLFTKWSRLILLNFLCRISLQKRLLLNREEIFHEICTTKMSRLR